MKFLAILIALTATALARPRPSEDIKVARQACTPGTYGCTTNPTSGVSGWQVCNVSSAWEYAGDCPSGTTCTFDSQNGSPYCE